MAAQIVFRLLFVALSFLITWLTLFQTPDDSTTGFELTRWIAATFLGDAALNDKVGHFLGYASLGFTIFFVNFPILRQRIIAPLFLAAYGASLEGLQGLGGVRSAEVADGVANVAGAISGFAGATIVAWGLRKLRP